MSTPFTPTPVEPSWPLSLIADGEVLTHANLISGLIQPGFEYTAFINARIDGVLGAAAGASASRVLDQQIPTTTGWTLQSTGIYNTSVNTLQTLIMPIDAGIVPHGAILTSVAVSIQPDVHASISALTLPKLELYSFTIGSGILQIGATTPDPSATFSLYNIQHSITISGLSTTIDRSSKRYFLQFLSEHGGGNAAANCVVVGASVSFVVP